jgi:hypothetical protein
VAPTFPWDPAAADAAGAVVDTGGSAEPTGVVGAVGLALDAPAGAPFAVGEGSGVAGAFVPAAADAAGFADAAGLAEAAGRV